MTIDCAYCTGSRWLKDEPQYGPCVCCTPENMAAQDEVVESFGLAGDLLLRYLITVGVTYPQMLRDDTLRELSDLLLAPN